MYTVNHAAYQAMGCFYGDQREPYSVSRSVTRIPWVHQDRLTSRGDLIATQEIKSLGIRSSLQQFALLCFALFSSLLSLFSSLLSVFSYFLSFLVCSFLYWDGTEKTLPGKIVGLEIFGPIQILLIWFDLVLLLLGAPVVLVPWFLPCRNNDMNKNNQQKQKARKTISKMQHYKQTQDHDQHQYRN